MCITQNHQIKIGLGSEGEERLMSFLWSPGAPRLRIPNNFIDTVSTIESDIKVESNVTWSSWGFLNVHSESTKKIKGKHSKHSEVQDPLNSGEQSMQYVPYWVQQTAKDSVRITCPLLWLFRRWRWVSPPVGHKVGSIPCTVWAEINHFKVTSGLILLGIYR